MSGTADGAPDRRAVMEAAGLLALAAALAPAARAEGAAARAIFEQPLPNLPGQVLSAVVVDYAPGGRSPPHRHAASANVFAYVLAGSIRSAVGDEPARVYQAGQFWFEPPGSHHPVSENASTSEPARLLAVFVAEAGARLTVYDP